MYHFGHLHHFGSCDNRRTKRFNMALTGRDHIRVLTERLQVGQYAFVNSYFGGAPVCLLRLLAHSDNHTDPYYSCALHADAFSCVSPARGGPAWPIPCVASTTEACRMAVQPPVTPREAEKRSVVLCVRFGPMAVTLATLMEGRCTREKRKLLAQKKWHGKQADAW
jgi:hypothetical protein